PCGADAIDNGVDIITENIDINGAKKIGDAGLSIYFADKILNCNKSTKIFSSVTPLIENSTNTDTITYHLPMGISYGGNISPNTLNPVVVGNTIKIGMPAMNTNNTLNISFDVMASDVYCGSGIAMLDYRRQFNSIACKTSKCPDYSLVIANTESAPVQIVK